MNNLLLRFIKQFHYKNKYILFSNKIKPYKKMLNIAYRYKYILYFKHWQCCPHLDIVFLECVWVSENMPFSRILIKMFRIFVIVRLSFQTQINFTISGPIKHKIHMGEISSIIEIMLTYRITDIRRQESLLLSGTNIPQYVVRKFKLLIFANLKL